MLLVVASGGRLAILSYTLILLIRLLVMANMPLIGSCILLVLLCGAIWILPTCHILVQMLHVYLLGTVVVLDRLLLMGESSMCCTLSLVLVAWWLGILWELTLLESLHLVGSF